MKNSLSLLTISFFLLLSSCTGPATRSRFVANDSSEYSYLRFERVDHRSVLFGIEYSFQDEEIVAEPGRMTMRTPHKGDKFDDMFEAYSEELGIGKDSIVSDTAHGDFKPGYIFEVPDDGKYTINMEPVTIEVNTTPKKIDEIVETSSKIFKAAQKADLVPYVNPAAERSGMGHIHVGARTLRESPLYQNPNLLRNILVYYHKHPSLLYGFAEAYDIGGNSNIETYHPEERQVAFKNAVAEYDEWFSQTKQSGGELHEGLGRFLKILKKHEPSYSAFCHHYRVVNLEHLCKLDPDNLSLDRPGKYTVEHRAFRPQKNADTAHANAHLLLDLYEKLSDPKHLEPFEEVSEKKFKTFWTSGVIQGDWEEVRRFIGHRNRYSDMMIEETASALRNQMEVESRKVPHAKLSAAFSQKENKGKSFELNVKSKEMPLVEIEGRELHFEPYIYEGEIHWIAYVDSQEFNISAQEIVSEESLLLKGFSDPCLGAETEYEKFCRDILPNFNASCHQLLEGAL